MIMKELKQSETRIIKRSQINLNPINPKRHSDERIRLQKKNLQKVGFLGGIVWNELSGNLIDGHRRIKAMDMYYKYDGTSDTDYKVKVEVVNLDEKKEKEQLTYMAVGNTKPDLDLLASYLPDIDYSEVGLSPDELNDILAISEVDANSLSESLDDLLLPTDFDGIKDPIPEDAALPYEEKKEHMKAVKQQVKESAFQHRQDEDAYIILSFSSFETKSDFCDLLGISTDEKFAKGEEVLKLIE
jgi:ParB-like chromosome segregation protein Spo0J